MTTREAAFTSAALQEQYRAPHPLYDELRAFAIYYDRSSRCWLVTSRKAITRVLGDPRFESHLPGTSPTPAMTGQAMPALRTLLAQQLLFFTGAAHTRAYVAVQDALGSLELRALIWSFNAHPSAHWWQDRARARAAIEEGIAKLVAC